MFDILNPDEGIRFISLRNIGDVDVKEGNSELNWSAMKDLLLRHDYRESKEGSCFIPVTLKKESDWAISTGEGPKNYRNDENVESISMAVLDLDEPGAREKAEDIFKDFEYILYSTHSYTSEKPYKFRIVLKLEKPIDKELWPEAFKSLISPIDADKSCGNLSRVFYFPSHNPKAGIRPYAKINGGKPLTKEDIKNIRKKYEKTLSPEELAEHNKNMSGNNYVNKGKKHFSGSTLPVHNLSKSIDYSYEGMKSSFSKHLTDLIDDDNRHSFALKVTGSAISKWGPMTDIFQVVQFIYKASTEYGSKPIHDHSGDTGKEIPEMIHSAIRKFSPDLLSGDNPHFKDIRQYSKDVVLKVEQISITDNWNFSSKIRSYNPMDEARKNASGIIHKDIDNTYSGWRQRHKDSIKTFIKTGDVLKFAQDVAKNETKETDNKINISTYGQFIFFCAKGYLSNVMQTKDLNQDIVNYYDILSRNVDSITPENEDREKNTKMFNGTLKIGRISAIKNTWKFEKEKEQNSTLEH